MKRPKKQKKLNPFMDDPIHDLKIQTNGTFILEERSNKSDGFKRLYHLLNESDQTG